MSDLDDDCYGLSWKVPLWDAIDDYVRACGGDPSKHVYGNTTRQRAVVAVEAVVSRAIDGEPNEPCAITGCPNRSDYEAWARLRDPVLGKPTSHLQKVTVCEEHKTHPWLCANEKREEAESP